MTNIEALAALVSQLSELELASFMEQLADHVDSNKYRHLWLRFVDSDEVENLQVEVRELSNTIEELEADLDILEDKIKKIAGLCDGVYGDDDDPEMLYDTIRRISDIL